MTKLIICPNSLKESILLEQVSEKTLLDYKFMTKEEFIKEYLFTYDYKTLYYLMKKYKFHLDVCKEYLKYLYIIDDNKIYTNKKLIFLQKIKKELMDNNLLIKNPLFRKSINSFEIEVKNYYDLDLYEEKIFNTKIEIEDIQLNNKVYEFSTMEDEINFVCLEIIKLIKKGIDINKIYLTNVDTSYFYTIKKMFSYYNIPINLNTKKSLYSTRVVQEYLKTNIIDTNNLELKEQIQDIIDVFSNIEKDEIYDKLLVDAFNNSYINFKKITPAVNIKDLFSSHFNDDEYVFVIGFNGEYLPKMYQDISYITDKDKEEVDLYKVNYLNKRLKKEIIYRLGSINNLYLSYKLSSPFSKYFPSNLITDLELEVIKDYEVNYNYSNIYNKIHLAEMLDDYYKYGKKDELLNNLYKNYDIKYQTYNNEFSFINKDLYHKNIPYPLNLSYTSLNTYNECKFKYYIKYVLKLDLYEDTFQAFVGSLYHHILTIYKRNGFDLDKEFKKYQEKKELTLKERMLLIRIKKELEKLLDIVREQGEYTNYLEEVYEKKIDITLREDISVHLVGFIDKIMMLRKVEDTYFSIIDYKTGSVDTNIEPIKYGLNMQLAVYLYLIHYSKVFTNPIFTGIYYQNILFPYESYKPNLEKDLKKKYLLNGYSTSDINILKEFDKTYENSELIKSLKYNNDKFYAHSKILDSDTIYNIIKYTDKHIHNQCEEILNADFKINPKIYDGKEISCKYCKYFDICFKKDSDYEYLEKVENLDFLEGDLNGLDS